MPNAVRRARGLANEGFAADKFAGLWRRLFATRCQSAWPQFALAAHYVHYVNRLTSRAAVLERACCLFRKRIFRLHPSSFLTLSR
jgi:hypothetical protein